MYSMSNPLLCCNSQHVLCILDPNVEFLGHFLWRNEGVSCIWLYRLERHRPRVYVSNELFYHCWLYKHISNETHHSVSFKIVKFWSPCNLKNFTAILILFCLYQCQSRIPYIFNRHDNVSALHNLMLGQNSSNKIYSSSTSIEGNETFLWVIPSFRFSPKLSSEIGITLILIRFGLLSE